MRERLLSIANKCVIATIMSFYDSSENVDIYEKMVEAYDPHVMINRFKSHVTSGSKVLELGIGPGLDHDVLRETFHAVGSDLSEEFLRRYRARSPGADVRLLDAVTLEDEKLADLVPFDAMYSNKVLHHLKEDDLKLSLVRQAELLRSGGVLVHCLWHGDKEEFIHGLRFQYYTLDKIQAILPSSLSLTTSEVYTEDEPEDSIFIVLRKNTNS